MEGDRRTPKYPGSGTGYRWSGYRVIPASIFGVRVGWSAPLWTISDSRVSLESSLDHRTIIMITTWQVTPGSTD